MSNTDQRFPALRRYLSVTPWALEASTLMLLREVLARRLDGDRLSTEELDQINAAAPKRTNVKPAQGSIAVLPLWGILSPHQVNDLSSGPTTALDTWGAMFDELANDPSVATIVLDVDSPGGSVDLVPETAAKVRAAAARKQVVAVANTRIASAAYWIASQAGELYVSPSGAVGSIGIYAAHEDISAQLEQEGVTVTLVSAGDNKTEGNPFQPLSEEARATIQANVDAYYRGFVGDVAKGRSADTGFVEAHFGQGRMLLAGDAVKAGMADGVQSLEQTLAKLVGSAPAKTRTRADDFDPALAAVALAAAGDERSRLAVAAWAELAANAATLPPYIATGTPVLGEFRRGATITTASTTATFDFTKDSGATAAGSAAPGGDHHARKENHVDGHTSIEELVARREEIAQRMTDLDKAATGRALNPDEQVEFDDLDTEGKALDLTLANIENRRLRLETIAARGGDSNVPAVAIGPGKKEADFNIGINRIPENPFDLAAYRSEARSIDDLQSLQTSGALKIAEGLRFVDGDKTETHDRVDGILHADEKAEFSRRVIVTGNPAYDRAFGKAIMRGRDSLSTHEDGLIKAAISESGLGSETPVPITIDPTVLLTSNGQTNPLRAVADVRTITGLTWRGITSAGITAAYESAEGNQVVDGSPTFGGGDISVLRCDAYVPFSIEVDMDWPSLRAELAKEFADAKDVLEGSKFFVGSGTNEPTGLITALTASTAPAVVQKTAMTAVFAYTDPKTAASALPVRWDAAAQWFASKAVWSDLEDLYAAAGNADPFSFAAQGGAAARQRVGGGNASGVYRGYPMNYASAMDTAVTTSGKNIMVLGNPGAYVIVDRIGMNVELLPIVVGANQRPTGQRGLFAYWRNNAGLRTAAAFQVLQVK